MSAAPESLRGARWLWLTLGVIAADRALKFAVERETGEGFRRQLIPSFAALVHSTNQGIAFGLLSESASRWVAAALILSASAVVLFLAWLLIAGHAGSSSASQAGFALIAGGAAGNLLDRLLHGGVTDFLELRAGTFVWPAFNLADSAITIGAFLVFLELVRGEPRASGART